MCESLEGEVDSGLKDRQTINLEDKTHTSLIRVSRGEATLEWNETQTSRCSSLGS